MIWLVKNVPELRPRKLHVFDKVRRFYSDGYQKKKTRKTDLWNRFVEYMNIFLMHIFKSPSIQIIEGIFWVNINHSGEHGIYALFEN